MINYNLNRDQWHKLAFYGDVRDVHSISKMKQYIKDTYHGEFNQKRGYGTVSFEHEHQLTWFLLNI
jgi:hypothetical protein